MQDQDENVKKKVSWALRVISKYYPLEVYDFIKKWNTINNKNTKWIIKNVMKLYNKNNNAYIL